MVYFNLAILFFFTNFTYKQSLFFCYWIICLFIIWVTMRVLLNEMKRESSNPRMKNTIAIPHNKLIWIFPLFWLFPFDEYLLNYLSSSFSETFLFISIAELYWRQTSFSSLSYAISSLSVDDILINYDAF